MFVLSRRIVAIILCIASASTSALILSTIPASTQRLELFRSLAKGGARDLTFENMEECTKLCPGRTEVEVLLGASRADRDKLREQWHHIMEQKVKEGKKSLSIEERLGFSAWKSALAEDHSNVEANLETFRRVVALRQNRILVPGRAAELYVCLVSSLLNADECALCKRVLDYVGISPHVYLKEDEEKRPGHGLIDLDFLSHNVAQIMLDLPLRRLEWELDGQERGIEEPLSPREAGENLAEWHFKQVLPEAGFPEIEYRCVDMTLSMVRAAMVHARDVAVKNISIRLQQASQDRPYLGLAKRGMIIQKASIDFLLEQEGDGLNFTFI